MDFDLLSNQDDSKAEFSELNKMQQSAVFSTEGPLLVLAGAGSGKTTVLVNRIANMIKYNGVNPWQILAITFTNKAAGELKDRLENMLGDCANDIWASTFHSACVRILRRNHEYLGFTSNFTIYDTDDSKRVVKQCMKELNLSEKMLSPKSIISEISNAKNELISPDMYLKEYMGDVRRHNIGLVYKAYQSALKNSDAMDFDDLIVKTVELFQNNPEILDYYQNKFRYILVDEYQDTNHMQYLLVSLLSRKYQNICVVGDDDQSIYRFRGATIENILSFESEYSNSQVIRLEQNYRSTQNILDAANAVIKHNERRKGKNLWTDNGKGEKIKYRLCEDDRSEGTFICDTIVKGVRDNQKFSDFAVLYRMNSQSNNIEQALVKASVPYRIIGGHKFYDRKEIKDAIAYLSVVSNPNDSVRLSRIINEPRRGIGDASLNAAMEIANGLNIGIFDVIKSASDYPKLLRASKKFVEFSQFIEKCASLAEVQKPSEVLEFLLEESGYIESLELEPEKKEDRLENLDQLINNMKNFENEHEDATINDFLQDVALMTDIDNYNQDSDSVVLMTIHAAKGLEFPTVFIAGMEESIFPSDMALQEGAEGVEEERRLAYVGITRAKKQLYISSCKSRVLFGSTRYNRPSRFFNEIPKELIEDISPATRSGGHYQQIDSFYKKQSQSGKPNYGKSEKSGVSFGFSGQKKTPNSSVSEKFRVGDTVKHSAFGEGIVLSCTELGNDTMLEVAFNKVGTKKMMANFAKLIKV